MRVIDLGTRLAPSLRRLFAAGMRGHSPLETIKRRELPYWQERGWIRQGDFYWGNYQTQYGSFGGLVEQRGSRPLQFYMFDPPQEIRGCSHWSCFQPRGEKGFLVHMGRQPADVSSGIITIERLITDAFEGRV